MAGYEDTRKMIIDTLMGREEGTLIQPEDHQTFALQITDYIHSVELAMSGSFIGVVNNNNIYPIQPAEQNAVYYSTSDVSTTNVFTNFRDINGNPISVVTDSSHVALITLLWNKSYWEKNVLMIPAGSGGGGGGGASALSDLNDVLVQNISNGDFLTYSTDLQKWINTSIPMTSIKMNGTNYSREDNGVIDLGSVLTQHQDISGKEDKSNKVTAFQANPDNTHYPSEKLVKDSLDSKIDTAKIGVAGGVAELDANGLVPASQLPSYVDDVKEYSSLSIFPVTGEADKIYIALDTNLTYRWGGSSYVPVGNSLALGETSSTAYRGDRGKVAYDHSQLTSGNPHNVTASDLNLATVASTGKYKDLVDKPTEFVEVRYSELVTLISANKLMRGQWYRITDYETTTARTNTYSAGHNFDLLVCAISNNELYEKAFAINNANSSYFQNLRADLSKWQIWYDVKNDTQKYDWADSVNGKGVIYRMIDEWGNDFPYDFKNMLFRIGARSRAGTVAGVNYYTFTYASGQSDSTIEDFSLRGKCRNNRFEGNVIDNSGLRKLGFVVFRNGTNVSNGFENNVLKYGCNDVAFGYNCNCNTLDIACSSIEFGSGCNFNQLGKQNNKNVFGDSCVGNKLGDNCIMNFFISNCSYNTIGDCTYYSYLTDYCRDVHIGNDCYCIIMCDSNYNNGSYYRNINVGDSNRYISIHNIQTTPGVNNYLQNITIEKNFKTTSNNFYNVSSVERNLSYTTKIGLDSSGNVRIYCEEDAQTGIQSMDFTFDKTSLNTTDYDFPTENGRDYIFAEIDTDISIRVNCKNKAENYIRFYNSGSNDAKVTIDELTSAEGVSINSGWAGVGIFVVKTGMCVEVSFVIYIPDQNNVNYCTVMCSESYPFI